MGATSSLDQIRADLAYWYQNTHGVTFGWQKTWGKPNPVLYAATNANSKPNSNAFILEADWVPFGKADSFGSPWANLKLGAQYTIYTEFNGAARNCDGNGRDAGANNTLPLFAWLTF